MDDPSSHSPAPVRAGISTSGPRKNWPQNCWWVAAHASEVGDTPVMRWVLETPVALYRTEAGGVAALHNQCPHRFAPLHLGTVSGESLVCPYHGIEFAPDGRCNRIPTQASIPSTLKVRAFPVVERYGFVWVWTGQAELADVDLIPVDLAYLSDPKWHVVWGYKAVNANYMQIKENVLDLTHFAFLHKNSLQIPGWDRAPAVEVGETTVSYRQIFDADPLPAVYAVPAGKPVGKIMNRVNWGTHLTPAAHHGAVDMHDPNPEPGGLERFHMRIVHLNTPVSIGKSHYYWVLARDHGEPYDYEKTRAATDAVFGEDIAIVEATQAMAQRISDQEQAAEFSVVADQAALQSRRKVLAQMEAEANLGARSTQAAE